MAKICQNREGLAILLLPNHLNSTQCVMFIYRTFTLILNRCLKIDASLVDNHEDEEMLKNTGSYNTIFLKPFTREASDIPEIISIARQMDANSCNIVCDYGDFINQSSV